MRSTSDLDGSLRQLKKNKFVLLSNSYHGETLGALSVGNVELFKKTYEPLLLEVIVAPTPDCFFCEEGESWENYSLRKFADLDQILEQQHQEIAAVFIEPLVGTLTPPLILTTLNSSFLLKLFWLL